MRKPTSSTTSTSSITPCCTKVGLKRGPWTPEEDELLSSYINREGEGRWRTLPKRAGLLRCGKSCRLRWMNYLRPSVKRGQIAPDEEDLILRLHRLLGNRWSLIAGRIPGRTDNEIKNYWNTHLSKKLINQGIDPRTHKPLSNTTTDPSPSAAAKDDPKASNLSSALASAANPNDNTFSATGLDDVVVNNNGNQRLVQSYVVEDEDDHFQAMMTGNAGLVGPDGNSNFLNSRTSNNNDNEKDQHVDDEINYSSCGGEDVFSSFLNSLINEDEVFINNDTGHQLQYPHNQLLQVHHHPIMSGIVTPPPSADNAFGYVNGNNGGVDHSGWETSAALMSSSAGNAAYGELNVCGSRRRINEHHDDQRQL
uniref:Uncharacterized protein n=1 Tax=Kalanchoe fedtschenkoi TaxID=63787 RepID=A0A7N0T8N6_KALFE